MANNTILNFTANPRHVVLFFSWNLKHNITIAFLVKIKVNKT